MANLNKIYINYHFNYIIKAQLKYHSIYFVDNYKWYTA